MSRRWIWIAVALVIGAAALALLGDVRALPARLGGFRWPAFAAALGLTEGAMAMWLVRGASQLDQSAAVDATLLTRLATLWFAVGLGVVCLAVARRQIRRPSPDNSPARPDSLYSAQCQ